MTWKKITEKNTIASGKGEEFDMDGKKIAVFNQNGYHALDAICVHQDSSIAPGKLDGDIVESGITNANAFFPNIFADKYATTVESIPPLRPKMTPSALFRKTAFFRNASISC